MVTIPFALSVHHFISSVGADAGFAAFVAVALLVLLFFSQARETANLRRRADEAGQRVQDLEGQLYALWEQVAALPAEISVIRAPGARVPVATGVAPASAGLGAASGFPAGRACGRGSAGARRRDEADSRPRPPVRGAPSRRPSAWSSSPPTRPPRCTPHP